MFLNTRKRTLCVYLYLFLDFNRRKEPVLRSPFHRVGVYFFAAAVTLLLRSPNSSDLLMGLPVHVRADCKLTANFFVRKSSYDRESNVRLNNIDDRTSTGAVSGSAANQNRIVL